MTARQAEPNLALPRRIILLRGLARDRRHWNDFPDRLRKELPQPPPEIVCPDLPGTGDASGEPAPWRLHRHMESVRNRVRSATDGPNLLVGISMGGMIALEWAARHPSEVAGVVLINSSTGRTSLPTSRLRLAVMPGLVRAALTRDAMRRERRFLRLISSRDGAPLDETARRWAALTREKPMPPMTPVRQLTAAAFYRGPARITCPALVLVSRGDRFVDPACSERLAAQLGLPLAAHPSGGHELTLDDPAWVATRIGTWLRNEIEPADGLLPGL